MTLSYGILFVSSEVLDRVKPMNLVVIPNLGVPFCAAYTFSYVKDKIK